GEEAVDGDAVDGDRASEGRQPAAVAGLAGALGGALGAAGGALPLARVGGEEAGVELGEALAAARAAAPRRQHARLAVDEDDGRSVAPLEGGEHQGAEARVLPRHAAEDEGDVVLLVALELRVR